MPGGPPQKILIVRLSSIGDIVLTTPVVRALRRRFPSAEIHYLVKAAYAGLVSENPNLDAVITFPDHARIKDLRRLLVRLRANRYDLCIDLHRSWRTAILRRLLAGRWLTYRKHVVRRALYVVTKNERLALPPAVERYFRAVAPLGLSDDGRGTELHLPATVVWQTTTLLRQAGWAPGPTVGLVPGAGYFTKRWPPERFAELAVRLHAAVGSQILVFGSEADRAAAETIVGAVGEGGLNLAGRLSLMESVAALDCCDLVVANDTGLMHAADALGKNLVAIFGSTTSGLGFFPHGCRAVVVEAEVPCRPCSHLGRGRCPKGHFRCMEAISVSQVERAALRLYRAEDVITN